MKTTSLTIIALFLTLLSLGQSATGTDVAVKQLAANYNSGDFEKIWQSFTPEMQQHLPLDKAKQFFTNIKSTFGKLEQYEADAARPGLYKTVFTQGVLALKVVADNSNRIAGMAFDPWQPSGLPEIERNTTKLALPFNGKWTVAWGGYTKEQNYHIDNRAQKYAFDILITDKDGKSHKGDGSNNEDYYAFGKPILAPCDGAIVLVVDGLKDNVPGEMDATYPTGNAVTLKTENGEYLVFAHFKHNSIKVREGQKVSAGTVLGLCGNTGNSSEAHLHFHIQNTERMNIASGVKCYFDKILVNGQQKTDYTPVRNEQVANIKPLKEQ